MILYHGTTKSRGEQIVKDGVISNEASLVYDEEFGKGLETGSISCSGIMPTTLATTKGYVYLTNSLFYAISYGNKNAIFMDEPEDYFYVFKVDVDENDLEADSDEVAMVLMKDPKDFPTAKDTLNACMSARYGKSIYDFQYCIFPTTLDCDDENSKIIREVTEERDNEFKFMNQFTEQYIQALKAKLAAISDWRV